MQGRPEDYDAEEPELAERHAAAGRRAVGQLDGCAQLVRLLDSDQPAVVVGAANALYNLALHGENADALLPLGALPRLCAHLDHEEETVRAAASGVLMNVCATSPTCRSELSVTGLLPALLKAITESASAEEGASDAVADLRKNALGALNNLMLDQDAALSLRELGGVDILTRLLEGAGANEARLEDAASSLLRALQEDARAGLLFVECGGMPVLVATLASPNEELQVRICGLVFEVCEQVPSARKALHELKAVSAILPLLTSSAEEVQEAAARALEKLSRMPAAAVAVRRSDGIPLLIDLMTSADEGVQVGEPPGDVPPPPCPPRRPPARPALAPPPPPHSPEQTNKIGHGGRPRAARPLSDRACVALRAFGLCACVRVVGGVRVCGCAAALLPPPSPRPAPPSLPPSHFSCRRCRRS